MSRGCCCTETTRRGCVPLTPTRHVCATHSLAQCPYCEKVWLQLEEKRIPYRLEKVNMRCYGDKPASFLAKVPSGLLPALEFDGKLYTESAAIAALLEREFPQHTPLLPAAGTSARRSADVLLRLERELFGKWLNWLTSSWNDAGGRAGFEGALSEVERALGASGGPYFLGAELSLVDITFAPFLERMAASLAYYKGMHLRGRGTWPRLEAWFDAMCARPTFHAIQSDYYTHAHDLPPQLGGCEFNAAGKAVSAAIDGTDGRSWHLPLGRLDGHSLEPYSRGDSPMSDRLEAAVKMIGNHEPVVRFAARGCGEVGKRPVSARLCDPSATPGEEYLPDVDAALRLVAQALITGAAQDGAAPLATQGGVQRRNEPVLVAAAYLRDRICVPRDLKFPAARQLRAHLNWLIDGLNRVGAAT